MQTGQLESELTITRLDYLISQIAFQKKDREWVEASPELIGFISHSRGRRTFSLGELPNENFRALRFTIGLTPEINHCDPNQIPSGDPLNPQLNNLHWTWQDGFIFMALEGHHENNLGFSYHLGNDTNTATITLPLELTTDAPRTLHLSLDLAVLLGANGIDYEATTSTHSRPGDPIPGQMTSLLKNAFTVEGQREGVFQALEKPAPQSPTHGRPYRSFLAKHLPEAAFPADNPLTHEGVELGRRLFNDPLLSRQKNISCASCHQRENAFSDPAPLSFGTNGDTGKRNSMPLFNLVWHQEFFWDGRAKTLREQILHPIEDSLEMDLPVTDALQRLQDDERYPALFEKTFGSDEVTSERFAKAIEQFLLTLVSQDSRFDQALRGEVEFSEEEKRGFELFITEHDPANGLRGADCFHCHGGPLLTNHSFANNGLDQNFSDRGFFETTGDPADDGKFKVPSLRNVAVTGPYMHDGRFTTLAEVIEHYDSGVKRSPTLDPNLAKHPTTGLDLTDDDKAALLAFLESLTDHQFIQTNTQP
jgi:cytochrome c peroxidase